MVIQRKRRIRQGLAAVCALVVTALAGGGVAIAQVPHGALLAVPGAGGCLGHDCPVPLRGIPHGSVKLVLGDSGRLLYALRDRPAALAILTRDPRTGALAQLPGRRGCLRAQAGDGCRVVAAFGHHGLNVLPDGRLVIWLGHRHRLLLHVDPRTGALHRIAVVRGCLAAIDGPCLTVRGVTGARVPMILSVRLGLITGRDRRGNGGFAVIRRGRDGRWHGLAGAGGCVMSDGTHGCTKLACNGREEPTTAALSADGRLLYVGGGDPDNELTMQGYVETFRIQGDGTVSPLGCAAVGGSVVPLWMAPLPRSSTVLIAGMYGNRGTGFNWERLYAARPAAGGGLGSPRRISGDLAGVEGPIALARDGRTLYDIGQDGTSLEALRVTPAAARRLPSPFGLPFRQTGPYGFYGANDMVTTAGAQFVYLATSIAPGQGLHAGPSIRAFRAAR